MNNNNDDDADNGELREITRRLFKRKDPADIQREILANPQPRARNYVPSEGANPDAGKDPQESSREYVRSLFGRTSTINSIAPFPGMEDETE